MNLSNICDDKRPKRRKLFILRKVLTLICQHFSHFLTCKIIKNRVNDAEKRLFSEPLGQFTVPPCSLCFTVNRNAKLYYNPVTDLHFEINPPNTYGHKAKNATDR